MNLWDILRTVGGGVIKAVVPGGGMILDVVNQLLPADKRLGVDATGQDMQQAIEGLSSEDRRSLFEKEFDVDITEIKESHSTLRVMLESDSRNPHSTRPYIARHSFHVVGFTTMLIILLWSYAVAIENHIMVETLTGGWPFIVAVLAPLVGLLMAYFGILRREHRDRLNAADTKPTQPTGLVGLISALVKR